MDNGTIKKFEELAQCHIDSLVHAAHDRDDTMWINMCNIYGFRDEEKTLKQHILSSTQYQVESRMS
jgi:hypothetical protein